MPSAYEPRTGSESHPFVTVYISLRTRTVIDNPSRLEPLVVKMRPNTQSGNPIWTRGSRIWKVNLQVIYGASKKSRHSSPYNLAHLLLRSGASTEKPCHFGQSSKSVLNSPSSPVRALSTAWLSKHDFSDGLTGRHGMASSRAPSRWDK